MLLYLWYKYLLNNTHKLRIVLNYGGQDINSVKERGFRHWFTSLKPPLWKTKLFGCITTEIKTAS